MSTQITTGYQKLGSMTQNDFFTDPLVPDPENLPVPLGWNILVRPYPIEETTSGGIIMTGTDVDFLSKQANIARVVAVGPSCWNRSQHKDKDGNYFPWVEVGEFISYPRHKGADRKFKGVCFVVLSDDDIIEKLPDPIVFTEKDVLKFNIPKADLLKYKTIYNPAHKGV